jgi:ATP-dependent Clp protease ATP-binding subunit ClpC
MKPFHQFNEQARKAMDLAREESGRLHHGFIGTEHILLGLLREESGVATGILRSLGVDAARVRAEIDKLITPSPNQNTEEDRPLTPRARTAINHAASEALVLQQKNIGPEHLLVGLMREADGIAGISLRNLGLTAQQVAMEAHKVRLAQFTTVERIVRPVRAPIVRRRKMREELLAHLEANYEEELVRAKDAMTATKLAARRLGEAAVLTRELEKSVPFLERFSYGMERRFGWRAPETAVRWMLRSAGQLFVIVAAFSLPLVTMDFIRAGWSHANWLAIRTISACLLLAPVDQFLLGVLYFKMRDTLWGVFGSRQSTPRAWLLGLLFALVVLVSGVGFIRFVLT